MIQFYFSVEVATTEKISQLSTSACGALGDIFRCGPLPLPVGDLSTVSDEAKTKEHRDTVKDVFTWGDDEATQIDLVTRLSKLLKSAKEIKVTNILLACARMYACMYGYSCLCVFSGSQY